MLVTILLVLLPASSLVSLDGQMADILIAPYLPVGEAVRVGPWDLVPFSCLESSGLVPTELNGHVMRLVEAYRLPAGAGQPLGALAVPEGGRVGDPFERTLMSLLGHALLAGDGEDAGGILPRRSGRSPC